MFHHHWLSHMVRHHHLRLDRTWMPLFYHAALSESTFALFHRKFSQSQMGVKRTFADFTPGPAPHAPGGSRSCATVNLAHSPSAPRHKLQVTYRATIGVAAILATDWDK
jgi:hypothetical protein